MRRRWRWRFQKKRSSAWSAHGNVVSSCSRVRVDRRKWTHALPERLVRQFLLLKPGRDIVPAVGKVERRAV